MIDLKYHIIDSMTGGGPYNQETAEVDLEAYVQERLAAARAEAEQLREALEIAADLLREERYHDDVDYAQEWFTIESALAAAAPEEAP